MVLASTVLIVKPHLSSILRKIRLSVRFATGQALGFLSSWPLFALCHHFLVWYCADRIYPGRKFRKYALLGDDIVIGHSRVAAEYQNVMSELGFGLSLPEIVESLIKELSNSKIADWGARFVSDQHFNASICETGRLGCLFVELLV